MISKYEVKVQNTAGIPQPTIQYIRFMRWIESTRDAYWRMQVRFYWEIFKKIRNSRGFTNNVTQKEIYIFQFL